MRFRFPECVFGWFGGPEDEVFAKGDVYCTHNYGYLWLARQFKPFTSAPTSASFVTNPQPVRLSFLFRLISRPRLVWSRCQGLVVGQAQAEPAAQQEVWQEEQQAGECRQQMATVQKTKTRVNHCMINAPPHTRLRRRQVCCCEFRRTLLPIP